MAKRVMVRLSDEMAEKIEMWAEKLGVNVSQLGGMAVQAGLDAIIRAVSPVDSLTSEQWAQIVKAMGVQGVDVGQLKAGAKDENDQASS